MFMLVRFYCIDERILILLGGMFYVYDLGDKSFRSFFLGIFGYRN